MVFVVNHRCLLPHKPPLCLAADPLQPHPCVAHAFLSSTLTTVLQMSLCLPPAHTSLTSTSSPAPRTLMSLTCIYAGHGLAAYLTGSQQTVRCQQWLYWSLVTHTHSPHCCQCQALMWRQQLLLVVAAAAAAARASAARTPPCSHAHSCRQLLLVVLLVLLLLLLPLAVQALLGWWLLLSRHGCQWRRRLRHAWLWRGR